jgi:hypothetical protein
MLLVFFERPGENEDVIRGSEAEVEFAALRGHEGKLEEAKRSGA